MARRKERSLQTARNMLHFYFNKASKNVPKNRRAILAFAKEELRILFGRN